MTFIKSLAAIFLFMIFMPISILQAQEKTDSDPSPLQPGSKALLFQISDNFNLESFSGSTISYKRQVSDDRARRIGLNFSNRYSWSDFPENDDDREGSDLDVNIGIDYTWMRYTNPDSEIKFFYGYGPGINFGIDRNVQKLRVRDDTRRTLYYGIEGIGYAGVEWFFQSSMSLHAEYRGSVSIGQIREKNTADVNGNETVTERNSTTIQFGGDGVRFGLSVYF